MAEVRAHRGAGGRQVSGAEVARYWQHAAVPGVDLLRARYVTHRYAKHAHETYTLALIEAGVEEFSYGGTLLRAGPGAVALLDPEVVHDGQAGVPEGWSYRVLYPSAQLVSDLAAEAGGRGTPHFPSTVVHDPRGARLVRAAHLAAERGDRLASSSLLHTALAALLRAHATPACGDPPRITRERRVVAMARGLLHERITEPPDLDELARLTGISRFALLRAFRAETGLPPHAYLNQVRVRAARALLDTGVVPAEAAARVGFCDQAHLSRHFKRAIGVPPGAYQRAREPRGLVASARA